MAIAGRYNCDMSEVPSDSSEDALIAEFDKRYMWWRPIGGGAHSRERVIAQVMNLGSYEDIRRLERVLGREALGEVMRNAAPGWFTPRAWEFWRGRFSASGVDVPPRPPQRLFLAGSS
jgi:hypothetical protein